MRFLKFIAFFMISIFIGIFLGFVAWILNYVEFTPQLANLISQSNEKNIFEDISWIAENVSQSQEYKVDVYDCTDFSKELVKRLNKTGINAYCIFGKYIKKDYTYSLHTWVEVKINNETFSIESTTGEFIRNETYNKHYRVIKKGVCL